MGHESKLLQLLRRRNPAGKWKRELEEFEDELKDEAKEEAKELTKQGRELESEMFKGLADEARRGIAEGGIGQKLRDILIRTRAEGSKGAKELTYLSQRIADEIGRLYPALVKFPELAKSVAEELARQIRLSVDDAVAKMQEEEGLTKRQALRRLNQQRAQKAQEKGEALAADEFKQFAARVAAMQRRFQPGLPPATPEAIADRAKQIQDALKEAGAGPKQQIQIGQLLNNPQAAGLVPGALEAMQRRGFGEAEAMRMLPDFFRVLKGGQAGFEHAADRMVVAAERAERAAAQRAFVEAGKVPRRRPAEREIRQPAPPPPKPDPRQAKPQEGFRNVPPGEAGGPDVADLAEPIAGTQDAMAQTQAATAKNQAIIARLNARVRILEQRARGLVSRAVESGPSAQNAGSSVA
jgi:hypothetical protein